MLIAFAVIFYLLLAKGKSALTFLNMQVLSSTLHRQSEPMHVSHTRNSPNGGDVGGEDSLADIKPSCQYAMLQQTSVSDMSLDSPVSMHQASGQLPPLHVAVGSQLHTQHHSIFAGSMYATPDYCHTPMTLGQSAPCLPQLAMWK